MVSLINLHEIENFVSIDEFLFPLKNFICSYTIFFQLAVEEKEVKKSSLLISVCNKVSSTLGKDALLGEVEVSLAKMKDLQSQSLQQFPLTIYVSNAYLYPIINVNARPAELYVLQNLPILNVNARPAEPYILQNV